MDFTKTLIETWDLTEAAAKPARYTPPQTPVHTTLSKDFEASHAPMGDARVNSLMKEYDKRQPSAPGIRTNLKPDGSGELVGHDWDGTPMGVLKFNKNKQITDLHTNPAETDVRNWPQSLLKHARENMGVSDVAFNPDRETAKEVHRHITSAAVRNGLEVPGEVRKEYIGKNRDGDYEDQIHGNYNDVVNTLRSYDLYKKHSKTRDAFNLPETPIRLGGGQDGSAFLNNDGKVVKFTADHNEALNSNYLKRNPIDGIWNVEGVYKHKDAPHYAIMGEKLNKDKRSSAITKELRDYFGQHDMTHQDTESYTPEHLENIRQTLSPDSHKVANNMANLRNHGIRYWDLHNDNIMFDANGNPKIIDLGRSQSEHKPDYESLVGEAYSYAEPSFDDEPVETPSVKKLVALDNQAEKHAKKAGFDSAQHARNVIDAKRLFRGNHEASLVHDKLHDAFQSAQLRVMDYRTKHPNDKRSDEQLKSLLRTNKVDQGSHIVPDEHFAAAKGREFIHNHPNETATLSPADIAQARKHDVGIMTVTTPSGNTVRVHKPPTGWPINAPSTWQDEDNHDEFIINNGGTVERMHFNDHPLIQQLNKIPLNIRKHLGETEEEPDFETEP